MILVFSSYCSYFPEAVFYVARGDGYFVAAMLEMRYLGNLLLTTLGMWQALALFNRVYTVGHCTKLWSSITQQYKSVNNYLLDIYSVDRIGIELILKYVNSPQ
jgi:hypothetical protein